MARSKEFEINDVLDKAMNLFWQQGYEKTSIQELTTHMGIHRRSLYDTFGDKHDLFLDALDRYMTKINTEITNRIHQTNSAKQAIRQLFEMTVNGDENQPKGCLMVNSAAELANLDSVVAANIKDEFVNTEKLIYDLIVSGQQVGEISTQHDAESLSLYFHNAWVGLRVIVKTTDNKDKLIRIVDTTMAVLD